MSFKIIKNFKQSLKYFYNNFLPEYLRIKISILFDPLPQNRLRASISVRLENFQACIKKLEVNNHVDNKNYYLHKVFKKHLVRSNLIDNDWWSDFILLVNSREESSFKKINKSLIDRIDYSNFSSLYHFEINDIYSLCIRFNLFELGYHLRQKSVEVALRYPSNLKKNENWKLKAKLSAFLETENFQEFDKLFPLFQSKREQEKYFLNYLRKILEINKNLSSKDQFFKIKSKQDIKFGKFIENKKIAIVSPKPVSEKDGFKIDNSDIVIRTNNTLGNTINKGSRNDVIYFNLTTSEYIRENGCSKWPTDIKWAVGKARYYMDLMLKRLFLDRIDIENFNTRVFERIDNALFCGSLLVLPNIIVDILRYNPKEIYLYHFDLMLSKDRDYKKKLNLDYTKALAGHDPVTNFIILKLFWKKGFIKGDKYFEEVIKMETEDYMKNLQINYLTVINNKLDKLKDLKINKF